MRDQEGRLLHVVAVPWSSVVGQSLTIQDHTGKVVGQISLLQMQMEADDLKWFAQQVALALNRANITARLSA